MFRILLVVICCGLSSVALSDDDDDSLKNYEKHITPLLAGMAKSKTITVYEGLPHQRSEKESLAKELKEKKTVKLHDFPFYEEAISIKDEESRRLMKLCLERATFKPYVGAKFCGGFHPDWCVEFKDGKDIYHILICFGCHEAKLSGPKNELITDLEKQAYQELAAVLQPLRKNRPKPKGRGIFGESEDE